MEEIFVPASGMAMEEVLLVEWLKQPGDAVAPGEAVALVETDKSTVELSGERAGRLSGHLVSAGSRLRGGTTVAYVLGDGEPDPTSTARDVPAPVAAVAVAAVADVEVADGDVAAPPAPGGAGWAGKLPDGRYRLSPRRRREALLAEAASPAPGAADDSPPPPAGGAVAASVAAAEEPPLAAPGAAAPRRPAGLAAMAAANAESSNRRATAELVAESWRTMPHFSVGREVRADALLAALARARAEGLEVTATDFLLRAFARALEEVGEAPDVGLAVATQWGVLIPVLRRVAHRSLFELASLRRAAVERARSRRLGSADAEPPFATLSNLGPEGVRWFNGVIPLRQCALLTVGRIGPRPAVEGRGLVVAQMLDAVLTADHRRYDGVDSARLLAAFAAHLDRADSQEER